MLQTYEGFWDNGRILPSGTPIKIIGRPKVLITVLENESEKDMTVEEKLAFCAEIDRMAAESAHENHVFDDFEPAKTNRKLIEFDEE